VSADGETTGPRNKAERLALAGAVAPAVRSAADRLRARRVTLYSQEAFDKGGVRLDEVVTGYTTADKVIESHLERQKIEIDVSDGVRPDVVVCELCGRVVRTLPFGPVLRRCEGRDCLDWRCGGGVAGEPCDKIAPRHQRTPHRVARRNGNPWRCLRHALENRRIDRRCPGLGNTCGEIPPGKAKFCAEHLKEWKQSRVKWPRHSTQTSCAYPGCCEAPGKGAFSKKNVRKRNGLPWMCCLHATRRGLEAKDESWREARRAKIRAFWTPERKEEARLRERDRQVSGGLR
jgi:hypothetical protein